MRSRIVSIFLVLTLAIVGIVGFLGLGFINHSGQHACPVSALVGGDCPPIAGTLASATHHLSALQGLTQSVVSADSFSLTLTLFLALLVLAFPAGAERMFVSRTFSRRKRLAAGSLGFIPKRQLLRWLALHEKRDPGTLHWAQKTF